MEDIPIVLFGDCLTLWCILVVYNETPTRALNATSLKCCLPSTDAMYRQEKIHACVWRFKVASNKCALLKSTRFSQKKKVRYLSNRPCIDWKFVFQHYFSYIMMLRGRLRQFSARHRSFLSLFISFNNYCSLLCQFNFFMFLLEVSSWQSASKPS